MTFVKLYTLMRTDNFEGEVKTFLISKEIEYENISKELDYLGEISDGECSYTPMFICSCIDGQIINDYRVESPK